MKMLVFSDSHGRTEAMYRAVEEFHPDLIVHLGDVVGDAEELRRRYFRTAFLNVRGNCDYFDRDTPEERIFTIEGVRVMAVHGHRYNVKAGLLSLTYAAREKEAQLVLFGHTHSAFCQEAQGIRLLNPGSCGGCGSTCGVVELKNGAIDCEITAI